MYLYCQTDAVVVHAGERVRLNVDDIWDADDPFVVARPEFFAAKPVNVFRTRPVAVVETATAEPGVKRRTRV